MAGKVLLCREFLSDYLTHAIGSAKSKKMIKLLVSSKKFLEIGYQVILLARRIVYLKKVHVCLLRKHLAVVGIVIFFLQ